METFIPELRKLQRIGISWEPLELITLLCVSGVTFSLSVTLNTFRALGDLLKSNGSLEALILCLQEQILRSIVTILTENAGMQQRMGNFSGSKDAIFIVITIATSNTPIIP